MDYCIYMITMQFFEKVTDVKIASMVIIVYEFHLFGFAINYIILMQYYNYCTYSTLFG